METQSYPEDIDFGKYWLILKRHCLPAGSVFLLVLLLTAIAIALQKPVYEAQGKILFRKRDATSALLTDGTSKVGELEALNQQNTPVDTEAEVLRSKPLIEKTITSLNLKDKKGNLLDPEKALQNLTAKAIKGTDILLVSYKSADPHEAAAFANQIIKVYLDNNILVNRTETTAAREFITQQLPRTEAELRQAEVKLSSFKEENGIVSLKVESDSVVNTLAAFSNQIATAQAQLANTSAQIAAISARLGFSSEDAVVLNFLRQSPGVQKAFIDLQQLESQLAVQRSRYKDSSPVVTILQERQASLKALLQERIKQAIGDQKRVPLEHLQSQASAEPALIDKLIENLVNNEVARLGLTNALNSLSSSQNAYRQRANVLPRLEQELQALERNVETGKSKYELLVKRFQEIQISESQNVGNARVVAAASIPSQPSASKKKLILIGGLVAGSLLYVVTAFVLDLTDPSLKTVKELRDVFKYSWLGLIPFTKSNPDKGLELYGSALIKDTSLGLVSEAYRMIYSNLKLLKSDRHLKTIVVTSSVSQEGKSTVSANLAISIAQLGNKVLLVDADLHHPVQHHIWNLMNTVGLNDLVSNAITLDEAIKPVQESLHVLPAGAIPLNSLAIIDSSRMANLVKELSQLYDFVIFDTPPLILVSDVLALGKMVDGVLLVARPGIVDMASATASNELLSQSKQEVLGLAVNGIMQENEHSSYLSRIESYHEDTSISLAKPLRRIFAFLKLKS